MYARSTTLRADPGRLDAGIAMLRDETLPELERIDGFVGLSAMMDRETGECIVTASWESAEKMHASAEQVMSLRERAAQALGGGTPRVDEWEIAVMHRGRPAPEGACTRSTWVRTAPENAERAIDAFKHTVLPAAEQMDGFCSGSLLVDRETGRGVGNITFESRDTLEATRAMADQLRARARDMMDGEIEAVREYELVLAHLRAPELV